MNIYVDLHIHTALSPCGDEDMTPNNIINMAKLKGLDAIAITDHNSSENTAVCMEAGRAAGIVVIPGMELQTREDVHVITLFPSLENCMKFQEYVYSRLPDMKNREDIFGEQIVFDAEDKVIRHNDRLLLTSADISLDEAFYKVKELQGAFIPAHIDRDAFSIIYNLGFIPENIPISTLEYHSKQKLEKLIEKKIVKSYYNFIMSSDAHYLHDILEKETCLCENMEEIYKIFIKLRKFYQ